MEVLYSPKAFREHYVVLDDKGRKKSTVIGGASVACVAAGTAAVAAGHAAATASVWSIFSGWPLVGSLCAGKATAVGVSAGVAALGSVAVIIPAVIIGGGTAYVIYRHQKVKSLQNGSPITELAIRFSRVAFLPMLAVAVSFCQKTPDGIGAVEKFLLSELGGWGYSEEYIRDVFSEALRSSPDSINNNYNQTMHQLEGDLTGADETMRSEFPPAVIREFADEFKRKIELCIV